MSILNCDARMGSEVAMDLPARSRGHFKRVRISSPPVTKYNSYSSEVSESSSDSETSDDRDDYSSHESSTESDGLPFKLEPHEEQSPLPASDSFHDWCCSKMRCHISKMIRLRTKTSNAFAEREMTWMQMALSDKSFPWQSPYEDIHSYVSMRKSNATDPLAFARAWKESGRLTSKLISHQNEAVSQTKEEVTFHASDDDASEENSDDVRRRDADDGISRGVELVVDDAEFLEPDADVDDDCVASDVSEHEDRTLARETVEVDN